MLIEIVSHCWAKDLPQYAQALVYQASSLILHKPERVDAMLTMCFCMEDLDTQKALDWAGRELKRAGVDWTFLSLHRSEIGRRSIGRNIAAKAAVGDVVWFADVDQVFRDGVLDRLGEMEWPENATMIYPRKIKIHRDHATGDSRTSSVDLDRIELVDADPSEFVPKRYNRAIGGVQIVRGDFAREHGYLDGDEKWQTPTDEPFGDFRDDIAYRNYCLQHGRIVGVDLPGMHRIRHTRTTYQ